jgi:RimJ/RimL family protein N-acetyltransferase
MRVILETERLALREMTEDDLDFVAEMLADPDVMRHYPQTYDRSGAADWLARQRRRYVRDGHGLWLVVDRASGEPRGQVGLTLQAVHGVLEPELGYLVHRPYWRQGIAAEAAAGVRDWAFAALAPAPARLVSLIRPANLASQAVARRIGMREAGRAPHAGLEHLVFALAAPAADSPVRESSG